MTDKDNITLPREVVVEAVEALEIAQRVFGGYTTEIEALRTHLAAEPTKQGPVAWGVRAKSGGELMYAMVKPQPGWQSLGVLEMLPLYTAPPALAAEQPKKKPVAWQYKDEPSFDGNRWHNNCQVTTSEQVAKFKDKNAQPLYTAPPATHPGYIIGSHWLETAYSRVCAGEAEADVLRDCGWERVDEALRRDADRYRYLRDKAYVWDSDMPKAMRPVALWLHADGNAAIDAAIDAAMEGKR